MTGRETLLVAHVLLLVYWLGTDVGVFYGSFVMCRPGMTTETRIAVRRMMRMLDLAPRVALILMIPVALGLAYTSRFAFNGDGRAEIGVALWGLAAMAIAWAGLSVWSFRHAIAGTGPQRAIRAFVRFDWAARVIASAFFVSTGAATLAGAADVYVTDWLAWKATLFGVVIVLGLGIRLAARRYLPALQAVLDHGDGDGRLGALNRSIRAVYPPVLAVWALLVVITVVSVVKP